MLDYVFLGAVLLVAVALAGLISERHFVSMVLAVELVFIASTVLLAYFITYGSSPGPSAVPMLIAIWAAATVEVIALVTLYIYMKAHGSQFDISKLAKLKW